MRRLAEPAKKSQRTANSAHFAASQGVRRASRRGAFPGFPGGPTFRLLGRLFGGLLGALWLCGLQAGLARADDAARGEKFDLTPPPGWRTVAWGVTRSETPLVAWAEASQGREAAERLRVVVIGGWDGRRESTESLAAAVRRFAAEPGGGGEALRRRIALQAAPTINPDGWRAGRGAENLAGGRPGAKFPPDGPFYSSPQTPEDQYLWRWLGVQAPDLVVEWRAGERLRWRLGADAQVSTSGPQNDRRWAVRLAERLGAERERLPERSLAAALGTAAPADVGTIPAIVVECPLEESAAALVRLLEAVEAIDELAPSPARRELNARRARSPLEVLRQLSEHYGRELPAVEYIPAMALVGRLRLGELTGDAAQRAAVVRAVEPYRRGERPTAPKSGSGQSGHLIFTELARGAVGEERANWLQLARGAADQAFDENGGPLDVMPFHAEMSDAFFMGGPILAATGRLTGESRYFDACARHLTFMRRLDLRPDGLYRHSPLDETAWGRGNGFVALGLGLCLSDWPADRPDRGEWERAHAEHLRALLKHQDADGSWHQVIDRPGSYRELSCTSMITWAMARGVRDGRLDRTTYDSAVRRGWDAVRLRVAADGRLIDVCTGTGKQKSLRDYYDREAVLGRDLRGGAMAMLVAAEMVEYLKAGR